MWYRPCSYQILFSSLLIYSYRWKVHMSLINMLKPNPQCDAIWRSDLWKLKVEFVLTQDQQVLCNVWQRNGKAMTREPGSQPSSERNLLAPWSWFPSFQICEKCFYCLEALQSKNFSYSNLNELRHVPATVTPFILKKKKKKKVLSFLWSICFLKLR